MADALRLFERAKTIKENLLGTGYHCIAHGTHETD